MELEKNYQRILSTEDMDIMQLMLEAGEGIALVHESIIEYEKHALKVIEIVKFCHLSTLAGFIERIT